MSRVSTIFRGRQTRQSSQQDFRRNLGLRLTATLAIFAGLAIAASAASAAPQFGFLGSVAEFFGLQSTYSLETGVPETGIAGTAVMEPAMLPPSGGADIQFWDLNSSAWTGTVGGNNTGYSESGSVPTRYIDTAVAAGSHTVILKQDFVKGGNVYFVDGLNTYNQTVSLTDAQLTNGLSGGTRQAGSTIPDDPIGAPVTGGTFHVYNLAIDTVGTWQSQTSGSTVSRYITITYHTTFVSGTGSVGLFYSVHLANANDHGGLGTGASSYSGGSGKAYVNFDGAQSDKSASINPGGLNFAPVIITANDPVTVNEGTTATNTGTYDDPDGNTVTLTASVGTITKTGTSSGNWSWSYPTTDGPIQSQTVNIMGDDGRGGNSTTPFSLVVNNVNPAVTAPGTQSAGAGTNTSFTLGSFSDPGFDSPWSVDINWGDPTAHTTYQVTGGGAANNLSLGSQSHTYATVGAKTVTITVTDKDGGSGTATFTVNVATGTATTVVSSSNPSTYGDSISFTATVSAGGAGTPTGSVQFKIDGNNFGAPVALSGGQATSGATSATQLSAGSHTIAAFYTGGAPSFGDSNGSTTQVVNPKTLTASIIGDPTKVYDGNTNASLTPSNFSLSGLVGSESFTVTKSTGSYNDANVASATTVSTTLAPSDFTPGPGTLASNYTLPTSASGPGHITKAATVTTVTFEAGPYTYRGTAFTATANVTGPGGLNQPVTPVNYTGDCTNVTVTNGCTASATYVESSNYFSSSDSKSITITQAAVTATAGSYSGAYDGIAHSVSACTVSGSFGLTCTNSPASVGPDVSSGTVTATLDQPASNFNVTYVPGSYSITPINATCTVPDVTVPYDGAPHGITVGQCTGVGGAALTGLMIANTTYTNVPGGLVHWTFSNANYNSQSGDATLNITPINATCTVPDVTVPYDGAPHGITVGQCTGVGGAALTGLMIANTTYTNVPGGLVHWTFSNANYNSQSGDATLNITPINATCTVPDVTVPYDGAPHGITVGQCTGIGGAVLSGLSIATTTYTNVPGGLVHWTFSNTNYVSQSGDATLNITPISATCTVPDVTVPYDGAAHGITVGQCTGIGGAVLTGLSIANTTYTNVPGGLVHWTFSNTNYVSQSGDAHLNITPINATCTVPDVTVPYDGAPHGITVGQCTGVGGAVLTGLSIANTTYTNVPGGLVHWTFSNGNYNSQSGDANLNITPINATCSVPDVTVPYDGAPHGITVGQCTGVGGAVLTGLSIANTTYTNVPGGLVHWTFANTNYNSQSGDANLNITPINATCSVPGVTVPYDGAPHGITVGQCTGIGGAVLTGLSIATTTYTNVPGGPVHWTFSNTNYVSQSGDANVNITPINASCTVPDVTVPYDGAPHGITVGQCTGIGGAVLTGLSIANTTYTNVPGGLVHWTFSNINYNSQSGDANVIITSVTATCSVPDVTLQYDANPHGITVGQCTGVGGMVLTGLSIANTTYTDVPGGLVHWTFTNVNYGSQSGDATLTITQAPSTVTVTCPPSVIYDGLPHNVCTAQATGVGISPPISRPVTYSPDNIEPGTVTASASWPGDLNHTGNSGSSQFIIRSGTVAGAVRSAIVDNPVPSVNLAGAGSLPVSGTTNSSGSYMLSHFGGGAYTVTPSKSRQQCLMPNGITSQDAALVAQHVVNLITLTPDQQAAAHTAGLPDITALDAAFIAQWVVGICGASMNHAGEWRFRRSAESMWTTGTSFYDYPSGVLDQNLTGQDFKAVILGDVSGDWSPTGPNRPTGQPDGPSSVRAGLPMIEGAPGSNVSVPLQISNLGGQGVQSYQFDVRYDPAIITPRQVPVELTGTNAANLSVVYNVFEPGLLKVAVYGAIPASGDGVYANLQFTVTGVAGSSTPLALQSFMLNGPSVEVSTQDGQLTVTGAAPTGSLTGHVLTATGKPVENAAVSVKNTAGGRATAITDSTGSFTFSGLSIGSVYRVTVSAPLKFQTQTVTIVEGVTEITLIAEP